MHTVLESVENKYLSQGFSSPTLELQVFFNDHVSNDFNTLFASLPPNRQYFAAGVPGSFYDRLFPASYLHIVHSSYALQWLSKVPDELLDKNSLAWNKGRIHYTSASDVVANAYLSQFEKDMEIFLNARAKEIVVGGMMVLITLGRPDDTCRSELPVGLQFDAFGSSLMDMMNAGIVDEALVDSFNVPIYSATSNEMAELIGKNGCFSIVRMELTTAKLKMGVPVSPQGMVMHLRTGMEGLLTKHFGSEIIDELFERTSQKMAALCSLESGSIKVVEGPLVGPDWRPKRSASLCISLGVKLGNDTDASDVAANCWALIVATAYALPSSGNTSMLRIWDRTVLSSLSSLSKARHVGLHYVATQERHPESVTGIGARKVKGTMAESFPMNGGDGTYSYTKNSHYQVVDKKYHMTQGATSGSLEFQVFFSDHASNDFNTLFASLPPSRKYFAAGVPGSFFGRLFPRSSLHLVHSSYALQWLSKVPEELLDKTSPAWNKGKISYTSSSDEVANAYAAQFQKDMKIFLNARAKEIVIGGMMVLLMPGHHDGVHRSGSPISVLFDSLCSSLMDMVNEGLINESRVDSFNLPLYATTPKEITEVIKDVGCFSVERMEIADTRSKIGSSVNVHSLIMNLRAGLEGIFTKHFGREVIDELFGRTALKDAVISSALESTYENWTQLIVALKREVTGRGARKAKGTMPESFPMNGGDGTYSYTKNSQYQVPEELLDKTSPAWNKGKISYTSSADEVANAYAAQFQKDMKIFLNARAEEIVVGGMIVLIIPGFPDGVHRSKLPIGVLYDSLCSSLMDMVNAGLINESQVDSFNLPVYSATPKEITEVIKDIGCFSIERMEIANPRSKIGSSVNVHSLIMHLRAGMEDIFTKHFGREVIDELFGRTFLKEAEISSALESSYKNGTQLIVALKRE
ncbi:hypothetical protein RJ640_023714 [Escallonia rubra]|uniref:Uncharacterized protein n=1 Tax=Escallonia rubra TaxID=112253 RepID=A0AA88RAQ7_9ASTE|nr:hypothetical protein RJ640_023714 [Escallonia rubra]